MKVIFSNIYKIKSDLISFFIIVFFLLNTSYLLYLDNFAVICFFTLFIIVTLLHSGRRDNVLLLNIGFFVCIFFYEYWGIFYGSHYFGGKHSDDYNFNVHWTKGYHEKYGLNPIYIFKHLYQLEGGAGILHNSVGYVYLNICLRWIGDLLGGHHSLIPRFLNIFLLLQISIYSGKISLYYWSNSKIYSSIKYAVFLFPVMLFNSVHIFRDTLVSLILIYLFYGYLKHKKNLPFIVFSLLLIVMLFYLRKANAVILIFTVLLLLVKEKSIKRYLPMFITVFFLVFAAITILFNKEIFTQISRYAEMNSERFSGIGGKFFSLPMYIGFIPRLTFLIFVPAIGIGSFHQFFLSFSTIFQIIFFPFLFLSLFNKKIDLRLRITFLIYFLGVALSTATFRHVMMYLPFGIILVIYQFKTTQLRFSKNYLQILIGLIITFVFSIILSLLY